MKKLLALLLALAVSFSLAIPAFAANTALDGIEYDGYTVLSNCSDDELLAFLRENDIAITARKMTTRCCAVPMNATSRFCICSKICSQRFL